MRAIVTVEAIYDCGGEGLRKTHCMSFDGNTTVEKIIEWANQHKVYDRIGNIVISEVQE